MTEQADPEAALQATLGRMLGPRPDMGELTKRLQEMQRQLAALDGFIMAAARANSLDARLHHGASAVMAAEAAELAIAAVAQTLSITTAQTQAIERDLRQAIGGAMFGTGTLSYPLEHHTVDVSSGTGRVEILDPAALPARFWRHAEPTPDKRLIGSALKHGPVPGARMAPPVPGIRITARKANA